MVHLLCSNYDGKFKSVGCNKFTKLQLGKVSVILGKERILSWKGKDPFLSQERSSLQLGKVSVILGKERILSFPRMVKRKASKGERKGFIPSLWKLVLYSNNSRCPTVPGGKPEWIILSLKHMQQLF